MTYINWDGFRGVNIGIDSNPMECGFGCRVKGRFDRFDLTSGAPGALPLWHGDSSGARLWT